MSHRHTPLTLSKPGLSLVNANGGRLVHFEQDVLDIKAQIEKTWSGVLSVFFDREDEKWVIVEHCKDGTERIAFKTEFLSQSTIDKIYRCDQQSRAFKDPVKAHEEMDREEEKEKDWKLSEAVGESAERLFFALRKDGIIHKPQVFVSNGFST